jgi:acyl carrier protein
MVGTLIARVEGANRAARSGRNATLLVRSDDEGRRDERETLMDIVSVATDLRQYIATNVLEGHDEGLDLDSKLLEWGILNSIEISKLVAEVKTRHGVRLSPRDIQPANFETIRALATLVATRKAQGGEG